MLPKHLHAIWTLPEEDSDFSKRWGFIKANFSRGQAKNESISKSRMMMGDWQMAGYDLKDSGKHQLMVLFKTADGKKHFGGLHYGE